MSGAEVGVGIGAIVVSLAGLGISCCIHRDEQKRLNKIIKQQTDEQQLEQRQLNEQNKQLEELKQIDNDIKK